MSELLSSIVNWVLTLGWHIAEGPDWLIPLGWVLIAVAACGLSFLIGDARPDRTARPRPPANPGETPTMVLPVIEPTERRRGTRRRPRRRSKTPRRHPKPAEFHPGRATVNWPGR